MPRAPLGFTGSKIEVEEVAAELDGVLAAVPDHAVVEFQVLVIAIGEERRIAHGAELPAERHLREAHVARIGGDALQSRLRGKIDCRRSDSIGRLSRPASPREIRSAGNGLKMCDQLAATLTALVLRLRPNPGSRLSCSTPEPNGEKSSASNTATRRNALSLAPNW